MRLTRSALLSGFVSVALISLSVFPLFTHAAGNLVPNGDLETASGDPAIPQGWSSDKWGTLTAVFTYPAAGYNGSKGAKIDVTGYSSGDAKWSFTPIPVTAGTVYTISDNYSSTAASEVNLELRASNGSITYVWLADLPSTSGAWSTYNMQYAVPSGITSLTVFHLLPRNGSLTIDNMSISSGAIPTAPVINSFAANPQNITAGQSSTLSWNVSNATQLSINQGVGVVTGTSKVVSPTATTTYTLTATNGVGTTTATVTVGVSPTPPPSGNLIPNGNLETGSGSTPTGWQNDFWGSLTAKFAYPVAGKGGGKAAKVTVTNWSSGDAKWHSAHIPADNHTIYRYTSDYKSNVITNITAEFLLSDGTYQYIWFANVPKTGTAWGTVTADITVPTNAVSFAILHSLASNGNLTIDNVSLTALPQNPFPNGMVSFTFDDGLTSQYQNAVPILQAAGMKAGFYIITTEPASGDPNSMTWVQIKDLHSKGFEIGGHTRTHADLSLVTANKATTEINGSYQDLVAQGITPKGFVYPFGGVNPSVEQKVAAAGYTVARGSYFGLNAPATDKFALYDIRLDQSSTLPEVQRMIDQAMADKRWLVFEVHDVLATGGDELSITPSFFQSVVDYVQQKGASVVTLEQGRALMQ